MAERSVELLTGKYGITPEDIIIDPLVFPCATGDANYIGGAVETIEAIRLIKQKIAHVRTVLGISNVSFGLPPRRAKWSTRSSCTTAPRPDSIWRSSTRKNSSALRRIPEEERKLAERLLFNTPRRRADGIRIDARGAPKDWREQNPRAESVYKPVSYRGDFRVFPWRSRPKKAKRGRSPARPAAVELYSRRHERRSDQGSRSQARGGHAPLEIIDGSLMAGMAEVGRLFNNNELIVAEVLQSAEAMKASVNYLEQFMEKADTAKRGKVVRATVKGDVHDIGKNLVEIILKNNGYEVINLGIKVPSESLIHAYRERTGRMLLGFPDYS